MRPIVVTKIFDAEGIAKAGVATSKAIDLNQREPERAYSLQITVTGDGNITVIYEVSNDGVTYVNPTGATAIFTAFAKTSGPGSDGKSLLAFTPPLARFLRIKATEQNSNTVILSAWLAIQ